MKKALVATLLIFVSIVIAKDFLFTPSFPSTHDGENHLARIANYYLAVKQGQFPPRIAPNLEAGLGYPSFNFNYPLANMIALPLLVLNFTVEQSLKSIFLLSLFGASFGMYAYLKGRFSATSSLLGGLSYILAPYFVGNIYIRGNVGEVMAFALLPWVLWAGRKLGQSNRSIVPFILLLSALLLSHNLIAVLAIPCIVIVLALEKPDRKAQRRLVKGMAISALVVSFFWVPALMEKQLTTLEQNPINTSQLANHFVRLPQLISSAWDHGYSYSFPVDGMNFSLGIVGIIALIFAPPLIFADTKRSIYEVMMWFLFALSLFLTTEASRFLWELAPMASIVQFPWRLLFFAVFFGSIVVAYVVEKIGGKIVGLSIVLLVITSMGRTLGINYFNHNNDYWFTFPLNTTVNNENDPLWYDRTQAFMVKDGQSGNPIIQNASGSAVVEYWTGSKHVYTVTVEDSASIIEKTMYFPGWETTIDGQKISLDRYAYRHAGLINFDVEKGEHTIVTRLTQNTPARVIGNGLTLLGMGLLMYQSKKSKS